MEEGQQLFAIEEKIKADEDLTLRTDLTKPELAKLARFVTEELYFKCKFGFMS